MKPTWILQANVPGFNAEKMEAEIRSRGMQCHFIKFMPNTERPYDLAGAEAIPYSAHAGCFASTTVMRHIQNS